MTFEDITGDGRLWAVRYDGDFANILAMTFDKWNDHDWLRDFFKVNSNDLSSYFKITNLKKVRNFLLSEGACDMDGFYDLIQNKR